MAGLLLLAAFATVTFGSLRVANDGAVYFHFVRGLFGADVGNEAATRQFGSSLFTAPFYAAARVFEELSGVERVFAVPVEHFAIAVASIAATTLTLFLGWKLLTALALPSGPAILLLALTGSPLFYYAVFEPSYKHAVDALFTTLLTFLALRVSDRTSDALVLALGASFGMTFLVRYANLALLPLVVLPLVRDRRSLALAFAAMLALVGVAFALVEARGIPMERGAAPTLAAGMGLREVFDFCPEERGEVKLTFEQCWRNKVGSWWDLGAPAKMLFSVKRGMFLWTPLTALGVAGFVLLTIRARERRRYLVGLGLGALFLLLIHVAWADFWTGGFSFSQRFLASLFPIYLLGAAELVRRRRALALAALSACAFYSTLVAFTFFYGWEGISERDGIDKVVSLYAHGDRSPWGVARTAGVHALERWGLR